MSTPTAVKDSRSYSKYNLKIFTLTSAAATVVAATAAKENKNYPNTVTAASVTG